MLDRNTSLGVLRAGEDERLMRQQDGSNHSDTLSNTDFTFPSLI